MNGRRVRGEVLTRAGAAFGVAFAAWLAPGAALAYHDTIGLGGGAPVHFLILLAAIVAVALIALARWKPRTRPRRRSPGKGRKRRR